MASYKGLNVKFKLILRWALLSCPIFGYYNIFRREFYEVGLCKGVSMRPTIDHNDVILIKKFNIHNLKRGDIVICRSPNDPHKIVCKRVIQLQCCVVESNDGPVKVKKGCVWLEGENSFTSLDSRTYGEIPAGLILGKVVLIIWPFGKSLL